MTLPNSVQTGDPGHVEHHNAIKALLDERITAATASATYAAKGAAETISGAWTFSTRPIGAGAPDDAPEWAGKTHPYLAETNLYNVRPSSTRRWRAALARARGAGGGARVFCYGDSTVHGTGGDTPFSSNAWPIRLRGLLDGKIGAAYEGVVFGLDSTDSRFTLGTGWSRQGGFAPGLGTYIAGTGGAAGTLSFGPFTCDSYVVYYLTNSGHGPLRWSVDGGATTDLAITSASLGVSKATLSAGALGSHTLTIAAPTGAVNIIGIQPTTGASGVLVSRAGVAGKKIADFISDNGFPDAGPLKIETDLVLPDLAVVLLEINDMTGQTDPAVYQSRLTTFVQRLRSNNSDVLLVTCNPPAAAGFSGSTYTFDQYHRAIYAVADAEDVCVLDLYDRWISNALAQSSGYMVSGDNLHPVGKGYWDVAQAVTDAVLSMS